MLVICTPKPPVVVGSSFVTRDAATGNLMLDGVRFRFAGCNAGQDIGLVDAANGNHYSGTVHSGAYLTPHAQIDALLDTAELMNVTVIRAYAGGGGVNYPDAVQPTIGVFNAAGLEPLDYALQQCALRGIRLIIPLVDEYYSKPWYVAQTGGGGNELFHSRTATINAYKAHISFVLDHVNVHDSIALKDHPAVLCWETGNELSGAGTTGTQFADWTETIAAYIKVTKGAQQLVMDGGYGTTGDWVTYDAYRIMLAHTDILTDHSYDNYRLPGNIHSEAQACHSLGKAFVMGEWTWTDRGTTGAVLSWGIAAMIAQIDASAFIDGDAPWDYLAPGSVWNDGFTFHRPATGQCVIPGVGTLTVADEDNRGDYLEAHGLTMAGAPPAAPAKTQTLVDTFGSFDSTKWDVVGAAPTVTGGQLSIATPTNTEQAFTTDRKYDLTNSYVLVEMPTRNPGTGACMCGMYVQAAQAPYGNNVIGFFCNSTTTGFRYRAGGVDSDVNEAFSSTNHRWLRLRADIHSGAGNGALYWDVSADGVTWVNKRTLTNPGLLLNSLNVTLFNWNYGSDVTSGTAVFDNFNNA